MASMPFIVTTGIEKPGPTVRKSIRRHVMMGKNRGKTRLDTNRHQWHQGRSTSAISPGQGEDSELSDHSDEAAQSWPTSSPGLMLGLSIPRMPVPTVSTIRLASYAEPHLVNRVLQFSSMARKALFPLEACLLFHKRDDGWIQPLAWDDAYLHAMVFTTQDYFASLSPVTSSQARQQTLSHSLKTLRLLRERLFYNDPQMLADSTVAAVLALAAHAHFLGDSESSRHHLDGLSRIVHSKGGTTAFRGNPKLLVEILRCDIGVALNKNSVTLFFNHPHESQPFISYPHDRLSQNLGLLGTAPGHWQLEIEALAGNIDGELARSWAVMYDFCRLANLAASSNYRITFDLYMSVMTSVTYRLLHMRFKSTSKNEAIRLGLLAFSANVFLQWKRLGLGYASLAISYRDCMSTLTFSDVRGEFQLWMLMVGAVSLFGLNDADWMRPLLVANMKDCGVRSWSEIQELLSSIMWIGSVQDGPGEIMFEKIIEGC